MSESVQLVSRRVNAVVHSCGSDRIGSEACVCALSCLRWRCGCECLAHLDFIERASMMIECMRKHAIESSCNVSKLLRTLGRDGIPRRKGIVGIEHGREAHHRVQRVVHRAALAGSLPVRGAQKHPVLRRAHLGAAGTRAHIAQANEQAVELKEELTKVLVQPHARIVAGGESQDARDVGGIVLWEQGEEKGGEESSDK